MSKSALFIGILLSLLPFTFVFSQVVERVQYKAQELEFVRKDGESIRRLVGNVVFTQNNTTITCDSAIFYRDRGDLVEAFGRVRIVDDSTVITAMKLNYFGEERKAELRENVIYQKGYNRLTTDNLDYLMDTEVAVYIEGGELRDTTNVLTSQNGTFYAKENYATFDTDVVLNAPDYILKSERLTYNTLTKIATTPSETEIISKSGETKIDADGGEFRTDIDQSIFVDGKIETPDNYLEGEDLFFDDKNKYYKAEGDVKLTAKDKDVIILGEEGFYDRINGLSKIYGNPVMKKILNTDTFYVAADTMISIENEIDSLKRILAYNNVMVYKINLQGRADSASFFRSDSVIVLYEAPILWTKNNQIFSDTIKMEITENELKNMYFRRNAFMVSEDTMQNFNQIKGRHMKAQFLENELCVVDVNGNGESIYYAVENDTVTLGMNRILCSNMRLRFSESNLRNISFYNQPEAKFIPPHQLSGGDERLKGFAWRIEDKPTLGQVLGTEERKPYLPKSGAGKESGKKSTKPENKETKKKPVPKDKLLKKKGN